MNAFLISAGSISKSSQTSSKCNQCDADKVSQYKESDSLSVISNFWVLYYLHFATESISQLVETWTSIKTKNYFAQVKA